MDSKNAGDTAPCAKLITPKGAGTFFISFLLVFGVLMAPWPGLGRAYTVFYRTAAAFLFGSLGSNGLVRFAPVNGSGYEINIALYNRAHARSDGTIPGIQTRHDTRHDGYLYVAFLTALILATPVPWNRRGRALLEGIILLHILIAAKLGLRLVHAFGQEPLSLFTLSPSWERVLAAAHQAFAVNVTFGFVVSVFVWMLVSFRRGDWPRAMMRPRS
jgi:hypothetical protein